MLMGGTLDALNITSFIFENLYVEILKHQTTNFKKKVFILSNFTEYYQIIKSV